MLPEGLLFSIARGNGKPPLVPWPRLHGSSVNPRHVQILGPAWLLTQCVCLATRGEYTGLDDLTESFVVTEARSVCQGLTLRMRKSVRNAR